MLPGSSTFAVSTSIRREAYAVDVNDDAEFATASLCSPMRFQGSRRLMVSLENGDLAIHSGEQSAVLG